MSALTIRTLPRNLRRPILITAFSGWNDAAESATTAARYLASTYQAEKFAEIDPEEFYHFGLTRPTVRFKPDSEGEREIVWPATEFSVVARRRAAARPRHRGGLRAPPQVADLLRNGARAGAAVRGHPGPHPWRAAGRGAPHPAGAGRRQRLRSGAGGPAWRPAEPLRGADGYRRRAQHRLSGSRGWRRRACGPTSRTTSRGSRTPRRRWRSCSRVADAPERRGRPDRPRGGPEQFDQNLAEIVSQNAKIKAYVTKLESRAGEEEEPSHARASDLPPASRAGRRDRAVHASAASGVTRSPARLAALVVALLLLALSPPCAAERPTVVLASGQASPRRRRVGARPGAPPTRATIEGSLGARPLTFFPYAGGQAAVVGIDLETKPGPAALAAGDPRAGRERRAAWAAGSRCSAATSRSSG